MLLAVGCSLLAVGCRIADVGHQIVARMKDHFEVVLPAHQMLIELLDQFAHRLETLLRPRYASVRHSHPHASQELVLRNAIVGTYDTLPTSETSRTRSG